MHFYVSTCFLAYSLDLDCLHKLIIVLYLFYAHSLGMGRPWHVLLQFYRF